LSNIRISWSEYGRRLKALREHMEEKGFDAYLITNGTTIFYYCNFFHLVTERPVALLIELDGKPTFMGPLLEADHLRSNTPIVGECLTYLDYPGEKHPMNRFMGWLKERGYEKKRIGTDNPKGSGNIMGYQGPSLDELLKDAELIQDSQYLWDVHVCKSKEEIDLIKESCKWGNHAQTFLQESVRPGLYDVEIQLTATLKATKIMKRMLGSTY
jgi:Xaa-Pro dipeptidase